MYLAELDNADVSYCFLARDASRQAVGFCSFWRVVDELHINNLAVLPELRRTGIGSMLLDFVLKKGVELGARSRDAGGAAVERRGARAVRALRLLGRTASAPVYYSKPVEDALVLRLDDLGRAIADALPDQARRLTAPIADLKRPGGCGTFGRR